MGIIISIIVGIIIFLIKCTFYTEVIHVAGQSILKIKDKKFEFNLIWQHFAITFLTAMIIDYLLQFARISLPFSPCLIIPFILYYLFTSQAKISKKNAIILAVIYFAVSLLVIFIMQQISLYYLKSQILNQLI